MFDFTFRVPFTIRNPFANNSNLNQNPQPPRLPRPGPNTRPRPIPRPEMLNKAWEVDPPMVQKRRRGWQPTETSGGVAEPQLSQSVSRGELDRLGSSGCIGMADDDQDFPPTKRRRTTLTDTLLTSALNIALISGAVGITAYRLWKGEPNAAGELEDTPAYDEEAWQVARATRSCPMSPSASSSSTKVTSSSSSSGHRRIRSHVANRRRPAFIAPPRPASSLASSVQYSGTTPDPTPLPVPTASATAEPEPEDEMDEQMDWMSAQLRQLIAEGQKALGKEIVVASDEFVGEEEGLVDDGDEDWQDDEPYDSRGRQSTSRHIRTLSASGRASPTKGRQLSPRKQPASLLTPDSSYLSRTSSLSRTSARQSLTLERPSQLDFSPLQPAFNLSSSYPTQTSFEGLYQSTQHVQPTFGQTQDSSPDLVSAMERVRKAYGLGA